MQGNSAIIKKDGELIYNSGGISSSETPGVTHERAGFNTMSTPRGGQYQLTLPDGTKAWLNAESSITYPTAFTSKAREVSISGEVYLEVARNPGQPFKVNVAPSPAGGGEGGGKTPNISDFQIQVLGTSFNINAYNDESSTRTTLIEGSVKIINSTASQLLKPGRQQL